MLVGSRFPNEKTSQVINWSEFSATGLPFACHNCSCMNILVDLFQFSTHQIIDHNVSILRAYYYVFTVSWNAKSIGLRSALVVIVFESMQLFVSSDIKHSQCVIPISKNMLIDMLNLLSCRNKVLLVRSEFHTGNDIIVGILHFMKQFTCS